VCQSLYLQASFTLQLLGKTKIPNLDLHKNTQAVLWTIDV
jgi:hypothetical protein